MFHRERASRRRVAHVASCCRASCAPSATDRKGETSAEEVTRSYLAAIEGTNTAIGRSSPSPRTTPSRGEGGGRGLRGEPLGLLAGIPLGVKDNIATATGETARARES